MRTRSLLVRVVEVKGAHISVWGMITTVKELLWLIEKKIKQ